MIRIELTAAEKLELYKIRRSTNDYRSERALCVIMNSEGSKIKDIANNLKRSYFTIRNWVLSFKNDRISGLERSYSPGRPSDSREELKSFLNVWLDESPEKYGFIQNCWNKKLIINLYEQETGKTISEDTAERALRDEGYSYKRPKKSTPIHSPSKEEKTARIYEIIKDLKELLTKGETEIFSIDESHFSTEPYLIKGWFKKGRHFFPTDTKTKAKLHDIWRIESEDKIIQLEKFVKR